MLDSNWKPNENVKLSDKVDIRKNIEMCIIIWFILFLIFIRVNREKQKLQICVNEFIRSDNMICDSTNMKKEEAEQESLYKIKVKSLSA
jgi:hypothetical protein